MKVLNDNMARNYKLIENPNSINANRKKCSSKYEKVIIIY